MRNNIFEFATGELSQEDINVCVGNANDLDAPGTFFSYRSFVSEQEMMLPVLIDIFETNTGVK